MKDTSKLYKDFVWEFKSNYKPIYMHDSVMCENVITGEFITGFIMSTYNFDKNRMADTIIIYKGTILKKTYNTNSLWENIYYPQFVFSSLPEVQKIRFYPCRVVIFEKCIFET